MTSFQTGKVDVLEPPSTGLLGFKAKPSVHGSAYGTGAGNYLFKVNNRNTRTRCEICSKLTIKTTERRHVFLWLTLSR